MKKLILLATIIILCAVAFLMRGKIESAAEAGDLHLKVKGAAKAVPEDAAAFFSIHTTRQMLDIMDRKDVAEYIKAFRDNPNLSAMFDKVALSLSQASNGKSEIFVSQGGYQRAFDEYMKLAKNCAAVGYVREVEFSKMPGFAAVCYARTDRLKKLFDDGAENAPGKITAKPVDTKLGNLSAYIIRLDAQNSVCAAFDAERIFLASSETELAKFADGIAEAPAKSILDNPDFRKLTSGSDSAYFVSFANFKKWKSPQSPDFLRTKAMFETVLKSDRVRAAAAVMDVPESRELYTGSLKFLCDDGFLVYDLFNEGKLEKSNILQTTPKDFMVSASVGIAPLNGPAMTVIDNLMMASNPLLSMMYKSHPAYEALVGNLTQINFVTLNSAPDALTMPQIPDMFGIAYFKDASKFEKSVANMMKMGFTEEKSGDATVYTPLNAEIPVDIAFGKTQVGFITKTRPTELLTSAMNGKMENIAGDASFKEILKRIGNGNSVEAVIDYKNYFKTVTDMLDRITEMQKEYGMDGDVNFAETYSRIVQSCVNNLNEYKLGYAVRADGGILSFDMCAIVSFDYGKFSKEMEGWNWQALEKLLDSALGNYSEATEGVVEELPDNSALVPETDGGEDAPEPVMNEVE